MAPQGGFRGKFGPGGRQGLPGLPKHIIYIYHIYLFVQTGAVPDRGSFILFMNNTGVHEKVHCFINRTGLIHEIEVFMSGTAQIHIRFCIAEGSGGGILRPAVVAAVAELPLRWW